MKGKKAEVSTSTLLIIIAVLILAAGFMSIYFSELYDLTSTSYSNTKITETKITKGFTVFQVDAYDGSNGYYDEFYLNARLLPDSDPIALDQTNIFVRIANWSSSLGYRSGSPVQNDSGYVSYANETGYYQVEYLITSDMHRTDHVVRGESVRIYTHLPENIYDTDEVRFNIVNPDGISYPITVFTGDTIPAKEIVTLYPKI